MKKTENPTRKQEYYYEEDTRVSVIGLEEPKKPDTCMKMDYKQKSKDVNISSVSANNAFPDFEGVLPSVKTQKVQRPVLMVLGVLMVIVLVIFMVFIAITYPQYLTFSGAVTDLHHNVSGFQKQAMEEQDNLKTRVADLSHLMENMCTLCPTGWHTIGSSCCYLSGEERSWDEARDECYKVNSILVMIKDMNKSDSLFNGNRRYWIGLRRDSKNIHIWKWIDGSEVTFTNWAVNEPNYHNPQEHCGETRIGPWNDRNCDDKLYYICERNRQC